MNATAITLSPEDFERIIGLARTETHLLLAFNVDLPRVACTVEERQRLSAIWYSRFEDIASGDAAGRRAVSALENV